MDFANYWFSGGDGDPGDYIGSSLRFRGTGSSLSRVFASDGDYECWTWAAWVKESYSLSGSENSKYMFAAGTGATWASQHGCKMMNNYMYWYAGGGSYQFSTQSWRDPTGWTHVAVQFNTREADPNDRCKLYRNGVYIPQSVNTALSQNYRYPVNTNVVHRIGAWDQSSYTWAGAQAEVHFIDGLSVDINEFGRFNNDGIWVPKKVDGLTYGQNGFYLDFSDPNDIGKDRSGNGNDFTAHDFVLDDVTNPDYDSLKDSPTQNYCILNYRENPNTTYAGTPDGGLTSSCGTGQGTILCGTHTLTGGKYYFEAIPSQVGNGLSIGLTYGGRTIYGDSRSKAIRYSFNGALNVFDGVANSWGDTYGIGDVIGVAVDAPNGTIEFFKNGVSQGVHTENPLLQTENWFPAIINNTSSGASRCKMNFGQKPYRYPQAGYVGLSSDNMPEQEIFEGKKHFDIVTYTGNGTSQTIEGLDFKPDFVWIKQSSGSRRHYLVDVTSGPNLELNSNDSGAQITNTQGLTSFTNDGFTIGSSDAVNVNAGTYVAWCWRAGGAPVANFDGDIQSQVSVNETAGFSIVSYTGNTIDNQTVGHGLSKAPNIIIVKNRTNDGNWRVYLNPIMATSGNSQCMNLNTNDAILNSRTQIVSGVNDSTFTLADGDSSTTNNVNGNSEYIAYCWYNVPGYSHVGSYTGNSSANGPYIYLGFEPHWLTFKILSSANSWHCVDSKRNIVNPTNGTLHFNEAIAQENGYNRMDFYANGFKNISAYGANNASGEYLYWAFAKNPSGGTDTPTNAR